MSLGKNITLFRKAKGYTQAELGEALGVSNQAVSKWEMESNMPDVLLLPDLAKALGVSLYDLYGVTDDSTDVTPKLPAGMSVNDLPWEDDDVIRGVVYKGRRLLSVTDGLVDKFVFEIVGDPKNVQSEYCISVHGSVMGGCNVNGDLTVAGDFSGGGNIGGDVTVGGNFSGGGNIQGELVVGGDFSGDGSFDGEVTVSGNFKGNIACENLTVVGNVESHNIAGDVSCRAVTCDHIYGDVNVEK